MDLVGSYPCVWVQSHGYVVISLMIRLLIFDQIELTSLSQRAESGE